MEKIATPRWASGAYEGPPAVRLHSEIMDFLQWLTPCDLEQLSRRSGAPVGSSGRNLLPVRPSVYFFGLRWCEQFLLRLVPHPSPNKMMRIVLFMCVILLFGSYYFGDGVQFSRH